MNVEELNLALAVVVIVFVAAAVGAIRHGVDQRPRVHNVQLVQRVDRVHLVQRVQVGLVAFVALLRETAERLTAAQEGGERLALVVLQPRDDRYAPLGAELGHLTQIVVGHLLRHDEHARIRLAELELLIDGREAPVARLGHAHAQVLFASVVYAPAGRRVERRFVHECEIVLCDTRH